jgi:general secretion pathway protein H
MLQEAMVRIRTSSAGNSLRRQGFTLIELLVVLSIMAALFAVVPPLFSSASSANEVRAISRQMTAVLRQARSNAVATRAPIDFTLDLEQRRYQLADRPPVQLPADLELTMITGQSELRGRGRGAIRFFADGSSTGGRITLSNNVHVRQLDVEWLSGRVTATELPSAGDAAP